MDTAQEKPIQHLDEAHATEPALEEQEHEHDEPGAEGGNGGAADVPPAVPFDDGSALGDTDQHSNAQA